MSSSSFSWFKFNRTLHRDVGYFCVGLTIIFAISGIAVNHIHDWNPNYDIKRTVKMLEPNQWHTLDDAVLNAQLVRQANISQPVKSGYWSSPQEYKVFLKDGANLTLNSANSELIIEQITPRYVLKAFNKLHLNEAHKAWVFFSDIYAALLLFLACSSLFMVKGRNSPWRKKSVWLISGIILPIIFILI